MNITKYLNRINYNGGVAVDLGTLSTLQKQHLLNIPFENLDIVTHKRIELDVQKIYEKIVVNKRGGFCYELNGLFYALLCELGFTARMISARVYDKEHGYGKEYDHLAIITSLEGQDYLVDVGFGEFVFNPLKMVPDFRQNDERGTFIIEVHDDIYYRVSKLSGAEWIPQYIFTTGSKEYRDFEGMCHYHQTSADSHFTRGRYIGIPVNNGRIIVHGNTLKIINGEEVREREISEQKFAELLVTTFKFRG